MSLHIHTHIHSHSYTFIHIHTHSYTLIPFIHISLHIHTQADFLQRKTDGTKKRTDEKKKAQKEEDRPSRPAFHFGGRSYTKILRLMCSGSARGGVAPFSFFPFASCPMAASLENK